MTDQLSAVSDLGVLVDSDDATERRAVGHRLVRALSPVEEHEATWGRLLRQPGLNRHAAIACFAAAGVDTVGSWRPVDPVVADDWEGLWAVVVHGHEAEGSFTRWFDVLVADGAAAAAADIVGVVRTVRQRIAQETATETWVPDPADGEDVATPVSANDRHLLAEGATRLDAWLPTLT